VVLGRVGGSEGGDGIVPFFFVLLFGRGEGLGELG